MVAPPSAAPQHLDEWECQVKNGASRLGDGEITHLIFTIRGLIRLMYEGRLDWKSAEVIKNPSRVSACPGV